jgi:hypothetical protein
VNTKPLSSHWFAARARTKLPDRDVSLWISCASRCESPGTTM